MHESCEHCDWSGDAREINVHEETDHEVWKVFTCPDCAEELGRQNKFA